MESVALFGCTVGLLEQRFCSQCLLSVFAQNYVTPIYPWSCCAFAVYSACAQFLQLAVSQNFKSPVEQKPLHQTKHQIPRSNLLVEPVSLISSPFLSCRLMPDLEPPQPLEAITRFAMFESHTTKLLYTERSAICCSVSTSTKRNTSGSLFQTPFVYQVSPFVILFPIHSSRRTFQSQQI